MRRLCKKIKQNHVCFDVARKRLKLYIRWPGNSWAPVESVNRAKWVTTYHFPIKRFVPIPSAIRTVEEDVRRAFQRVRPLQLRIRQAHLLRSQREATFQIRGESPYQPFWSVRTLEKDRHQDAEHGEETPSEGTEELKNRVLKCFDFFPLIYRLRRPLGFKVFASVIPDIRPPPTH